jgi:hypothetical protein
MRCGARTCATASCPLQAAVGDLTAATLLSAAVAVALTIARLPRSASALMLMAGTAQLLKPVLFPQFEVDYVQIAGRSVRDTVPCPLFEAQHPDLFTSGVLLLALAVGLFLARRRIDVVSATAQPGIHAAQQALAAASRVVAAEDEAPTQLFIRRPSLQADAA